MAQMMRFAAAFVALGMTCAFGAAPAVLIVHDEEEPAKELAAGLERHGYKPVVEHAKVFRQRKDAISARAVFMYVHGVLDPVEEEQFIRYAEGGGRLIVLHHGIASAKVKNKRWLPFLGIAILPRNHPEHPWRVLNGTVRLVNLQPGHYVTSNKVEYGMRVAYTPSDVPSTGQQLPAIEFPKTEAFLNQLFTDARRKTVLFGFCIEDGGKTYMQDRGGWMMPAGKGHVFYFQPGHAAHDFQNRNYVQILVNAFEWPPGSH